MLLSLETMNYFANKGINVRYYPEKTYELFKQRVYKQDIQRYIDYYKNHVDGCESVLNNTANVLFSSMEELKQKAIESANMSVLKYGRGLSSYDYDTLIIEYNNRTIVKRINQKSKKIDIAFIDKEIEKSKKQYSGTYGKFADKMQRLLSDNNIENNLVIYPTTYGIGVWYIYNWNAKKHISLVTDILERNNIEYCNEFSDARWVYRFKISKKYANIGKLN